MLDPESGSLLSFVHKRAGHVAVTWKDITMIWGGHMMPPDKNDPIIVYCHRNGKWFPKTTGGDIPIAREGASAAVVEDTLYLMCGRCSNYWEDKELMSDIYALDLNSWNWTKLTPTGSPPFKCFFTS